MLGGINQDTSISKNIIEREPESIKTLFNRKRIIKKNC